MKTFNNTAAQGDVYFKRVDALPTSGLTKVIPENNKLIITHSETGHHHSMLLERVDDDTVELFTDDKNPLISWLKVNRPVSLDHEKSFDTHESILFNPGLYEVRRQREYTPEGFRKVQD